jgi:hypothetical protein
MNGPFSFGTRRSDQKLTAHLRGVLKFKIQGMFFPTPLYTFTALCPRTVAIDLSAGNTASLPASPPPVRRSPRVQRLSGRRMLSSVLQYSMMTPYNLVDSYELLGGSGHPHIANYPKVWDNMCLRNLEFCLWYYVHGLMFRIINRSAVLSFFWVNRRSSIEPKSWLCNLIFCWPYIVKYISIVGPTRSTFCIQFIMN